MKRFAGTVGALAAASAFGAVTVSDTYQKQLVTAATEFVASTTRSTPQAGTGLPSGVPTPTFWFDCTQTNGWEISAAGRVTKIPSLVGDRYLTTDQSVGHFPAYDPSTKKSWTVTGADFVEKADGLADGPAIDFGVQTWGTTSASGLVFDGRYLQDGDTIASNTLNRIGSVVTVLDSSQGGGWFLGGGTGYMWARGQNTVLTAPNDVMWASKLAGSSAAGGFRFSVTRQDGLPTLAERLGLSGGWQILSMVANAADVLEATGVGFADAYPSYNSTYLHGGGQKIAEMLIFREQLTDGLRPARPAAASSCGGQVTGRGMS